MTTLETRQTIDSRVAAGSAYLDEELPGWEYLIDLNALHMRYDCSCVLGQLVGVYRGLAWGRGEEGPPEGVMTHSEAEDRGFHLTLDEEQADGDLWLDLTETWRSEIERRRNG